MNNELPLSLGLYWTNDRDLVYIISWTNIHTHIPTHTQEGGPVSLDNLLPAAKWAPGFCSRSNRTMEKTTQKGRVTHNGFFKFYSPTPHLHLHLRGVWNVNLTVLCSRVTFELHDTSIFMSVIVQLCHLLTQNSCNLFSWWFLKKRTTTGQ